MAISDTLDTTAEYRVLLESCGLLDRSERGKLALTGAGAVEFLGGQVTNELADRHPGEGCYAAFLTHKGKMLGDLRILTVGEDPTAPHELLLDTERVALQDLFDMIRRFSIGYEVQLHKHTLERGLLSLIGPTSRQILASATGLEPSALPQPEHSHAATQIAGFKVRLIATEWGLDVLCDSDQTAAISTALLQAGARPVGEQAAEILRVVRGRPRYGVDMDQDTIPQEAALNERAVSFTKGCYVGQETVARLYYKGKPNRNLRGLRLSEPVGAGAQLRLGERPVGRLSSSVSHPALGPIGLALVRREAPPASTVSVGENGASAEVLELPFQES
ncbi:MAG: YgfZ/GcvT domain-containing protein [Solirubrobacteraceae bacterium]